MPRLSRQSLPHSSGPFRWRLENARALVQRRFRSLVPVMPPLEIEGVSIKIAGARSTRDRGRAEHFLACSNAQRLDCRSGNVDLNGKHVAEAARDSRRAQLTAIDRLDQSRDERSRSPDARTLPSSTVVTFTAQPISANILGSALELERRAPRDDSQARDAVSPSIISSAIPSQKYSRPLSGLRSRKGITAIDGSGSGSKWPWSAEVARDFLGR